MQRVQGGRLELNRNNIMSRTRMGRVITCLMTVVVSQPALADIIVTLKPQNDNTSVPTGVVIPVDILLSVDGDDDPLTDLRLMQFDFADTSGTITLNRFRWRIELPNGSDFYLQTSTLPSPSAAFFGTMTLEGFILNLTSSPVRVASIDITVNGNGALDAIASVGLPNESGAVFTSRFDSPRDFNRANGNLQGGRLIFRAESVPSVPDSDGDGVPDSIDAFPNNSNETTDTDGNGIGNTVDPDDDGDGIPDEEDSFPLGPQPVNGNVNGNDNSIGGGGGGGQNNDNGNTNMGPRATGGLCAQGMVFGLIGCLAGLSARRRFRPGFVGR